MSFLSSALTSIGAQLFGTAVSKGYDYLKGLLPQGAQNFLGDVGDFVGISSKKVGDMSAAEAERYLKRADAIRGQKGPTPTMNSVGSSMAAGSMTGAGAGAQMMPLGGTDRVSRALQDTRVAEKIMRMSGKAPIPSPNIRAGQTIGLGSATTPRTSLTKKFSK